MSVRYITIEREYGSAGTKIAQEVSKRCGVPNYGREIMETVAKEQNVSVKALEEYEESVSSSFLYSLFVMTQSQTANPDLLSQEGKLYVAETRVIQNMAMNGPAIFVGHCACHALKEREGVVRVFIHGNDEDKRRRVIEDYGIPENEAAATFHRYNKKRANYYAFCTQKKWNDLNNYDMVLDSSSLGIDGCAKVLAALPEK